MTAAGRADTGQLAGPGQRHRHPPGTAASGTMERWQVVSPAPWQPPGTNWPGRHGNIRVDAPTAAAGPRLGHGDTIRADRISGASDSSAGPATPVPGSTSPQAEPTGTNVWYPADPDLGPMDAT